MAQRKDATGQRYGLWTVIEYIPPNQRSQQNKDLAYLAKCDCGIVRPIRIADLRAGKSTNCGCMRKRDWNIKIGKTYGEITVMYQLMNRHGNSVQKYHCKCSCGKEVDWPADYINKKKNCGCQFMKGFDIIESLVGERFGKLTVLGVSERLDLNGKRAYRICQCDCGNIVEVYRGHLKDGHTKSCGCSESFGETFVANFLNKNNIVFLRQHSFLNLVDKLPLRFDFALFVQNNLMGLIEVQGEQHYNQNSFYYSESLVKHDKMKQEYCLENNIPLLKLDYRKGQEKTNYALWEKQIINFIKEIIPNERIYCE